MIDQELIDSIQEKLNNDEGVSAPYLDCEEIKTLLDNHKKLIEGNANLHREKMMLQNAMEQIAKSDPGASGNIARKIMASYGFEPSEN